MLHAATPRGQQVSVHVKVDTGLSRYGLLPDEVVPFVHQLRTFERLRLDGLWTHMARADDRRQRRHPQPGTGTRRALQRSTPWYQYLWLAP